MSSVVPQESFGIPQSDVDRIRRLADEVHEAENLALEAVCDYGRKMFALCDTLNAMEFKHGEKASQLEDLTGYSAQAMYNSCGLAKRVPAHERRLDAAHMSLEHHKAVQYMDADTRAAALEIAVQAEYAPAEFKRRLKAEAEGITGALNPEVTSEQVKEALQEITPESRNPVIKAYDAADLPTRKEAEAYIDEHKTQSPSHVEPEASPLTAPCEAPARGEPADHAPRPEPVGGGTLNYENVEMPDCLKRTEEPV